MGSNSGVMCTIHVSPVNHCQDQLQYIQPNFLQMSIVVQAPTPYTLKSNCLGPETDDMLTFCFIIHYCFVAAKIMETRGNCL